MSGFVLRSVSRGLRVLVALSTAAVVAGGLAPGALADLLPPGASINKIGGRTVKEGVDKALGLHVTFKCTFDGYDHRRCSVRWARLVGETAEVGRDYALQPVGHLWLFGDPGCFLRLRG
jgi:hypothetical protein